LCEDEYCEPVVDPLDVSPSQRGGIGRLDADGAVDVSRSHSGGGPLRVLLGENLSKDESEEEYESSTASVVASASVGSSVCEGWVEELDIGVLLMLEVG
jgi:hypothetical protein